MARFKVSFAPSVRRLPSYLNIVRQALHDGEQFISGTIIAQELALEPIQVRKDLAITGISGKPKKGYPVSALVAAIEHYLGWDSVNRAVVVGAGNLGTALSGYPEFKLHGLDIVTAFDTDASKIGQRLNGITVRSAERLEDEVREMGAEVAILTVPAKAAQETADALVRGGIKAIWNFTSHKLTVPPEIVVHREDLSSGYAMLSVMLQKMRGRAF